MDSPPRPASRRTIGYYEVSRIEKRYLEAAELARINCEHPDIDWLVGWLNSLAYTKSFRMLRLALKVLPRYFERRGLPNPFASDDLRARLIYPSAAALGVTRDLSDGDLTLSGLTAAGLRRNHNNGHGANYKGLLVQYASMWESFAVSSACDPKRPLPENVASFFATLADYRSYKAISIARLALRYYFQSCVTPDLTRTPVVRRVLDGIQRVHRTNGVRPLFLQDLRTLISSLGEDAFDLQARIVVLVLYFGGLKTPQLRALDRSRCRIDGENTCLGPVHDYRGEVNIGHVDDPSMDLRIWLPKWLDVIGRDSGPLFPACNRQGEWQTNVMSVWSMLAALRRLAQHAGFPTMYVGGALRKGFIIEGVRKIGIVTTAQHLGFTNVDSMSFHTPYVRAVANKLQAQSGRCAYNRLPLAGRRNRGKYVKGRDA